MWDTGWLSVAAPWRTVHGAHEFETEPSTWFQQSSQRDSRRIRCSRADALAQTLSRPHSFMASKRCMMYPLSPEPTPSSGVISCSSPPFSALAASFLKHKNQILRLLKCCCPRRAASPDALLAPSFRVSSDAALPCVRCERVSAVFHTPLLCFTLVHSTFCHLIHCLLVCSFAYWSSPSTRMSTPRWWAFCLLCSLCVPGAQNSLWCRISMKSPF